MLRQRLLSVVCNCSEHWLFPNEVIPLGSDGPKRHSQTRNLCNGPHTNPKARDVPSRLNESSKDPMLPPSLYTSGNSYQHTEGIKLLQRFENGFKRTGTKRPRYLDIGCGTGNLTRDILLNHCGEPSEVVGVDISFDMVDYARKHSYHPRVSYDVLDIATGDVSGFYNKHGKFDRVYSFFCLNWVSDRTSAFRNIARLLGDDGQFLLVFLVRSDIPGAWADIARLPRWRAYTSGWQRFISCHRDWGSPDATVKLARTALHQAMLLPHTCQVYTSRVDFDSKRKLMDLMLPLLPVVHYLMPDEEKEDFYDDVYDVLSKHFSLGGSNFAFSMNTCVAQGSKA